MVVDGRYTKTREKVDVGWLLIGSIFLYQNAFHDKPEHLIGPS
jgi:hypothetical protein